MKSFLLSAAKALLGTSATDAPSRVIEHADNLVPGGIYSIDNKNGMFGAAKLLLSENGVAHIRVYKQKFAQRPRVIDPSALSLGSVHDPDGFGLGHMPIRMAGFLSWRPIFLTQTPVVAEELEGYEIWKSEGGGVW